MFVTLIGVLAISPLPPRRSIIVCPTSSIVKLKVLQSVTLQVIVRDGVVVVDPVDELLQTGLVPVFFFKVEDDRASDEGSKDCEFIAGLLELLSEGLCFLPALLVFQLIGIKLLPAHL